MTEKMLPTVRFLISRHVNSWNSSNQKPHEFGNESFDYSGSHFEFRISQISFAKKIFEMFGDELCRVSHILIDMSEYNQKKDKSNA
jgi:hypothetical protein